MENSSEGSLQGESNLSTLTQVGRGGVVPLDHKEKRLRQREVEESYERKLGEEVDLMKRVLGWDGGRGISKDRSKERRSKWIHSKEMEDGDGNQRH